MNPGPGGWAAILVCKGHSRREISGSEKTTTNNRMEMVAIIQGLQALKRPSLVNIHTDSAYVLNAFQKGWIESWKRNGWKTSARKPVANRDLWESLEKTIAAHQVSWTKVKGHSGIGLNERADQLAFQASQALRS